MKNSLLVIRFSALGDVAMTVPVLIALKREYPSLKITVLTRVHFAPIFEQIEDLRVIGVDLKGEYAGIAGLYKMAKMLKKQHFTAIGDLHNVLRTKILKIFFLGSSIPFVHLDKGRAEKKALTRIKAKVFTPLKPTVLRYAEVFNSLGFPIKSQSFPFIPALEDKIIAQTWPINTSLKRVGIAPFAAHKGKLYPLAKTEQVVASLAADPGIAVFLLGSPEEGAVLEEWAKKYPTAYNAAGKIPFNSEMALISQLDVLVGMDSGNGHLAAMYGIPVITIWGVTHPYAGFAPVGQPESHWLLADRQAYPAIPTSIYGDSYPPGYEKAIEGISPKEIVDKVYTILKK